MIRVDRPAPGVARVTFDRPQARNAMTFAMWDHLHDVARELDADPGVRVVVFTGGGNAAFVAGTDIAEFRSVRGADDGLAYEARVERVIAALETIRVPTVAAIAGACTGGGVSIAATCDVRIGEPGTRIGVPIARTLGNCLSLANVARVAALVGLDAAKSLILTGALLDAPAAQRVNFLHRIVAQDALAAQALAQAGELAALAPLTLRATKEMARRLRAAAVLPPGDDLVRLCYGSEDFREGAAAFLDKRAARWTGR